MNKYLLITLFFISPLFLIAQSLESKISNMIVIGFEGSDINSSHTLYKYLQTNSLGGVILFDKNIKNPKQLKNLTSKLKSLSKNRVIISVDEEGGRVSRLGKVAGFIKTPSASKIAEGSLADARKRYEKMAKMLQDSGINCNFAPSVDLALNPKNVVIVKNGRSFSDNPKTVISYANIFIAEMQKRGIITSLKHFPGHGSSLGDSHKGFVDVSDSWLDIELTPFQNLKTPMIMTAHIYNKNIDSLYPATLSYKTNELLLREKLGFKGVIISDDLQMGAISKNYTLKKTLQLCINSGVDMLLFANQLSKPLEIDKIVNIVVELVREKRIDIDKIDKANKRIEKLKSEYL